MQRNTDDTSGGKFETGRRNVLKSIVSGATLGSAGRVIGTASAASGEYLGEVRLPGHDSSVGATFTGEYFVTLDGLQSTTLQIYDPPADGDGTATLVAEKQVRSNGSPVQLTCLEWDAGREKVWGATNSGNSPVYLLDLGDPSDGAGSVAAEHRFNADVQGYSLMDGIALDARNDTLWLSPDVSTDIWRFDVATGEQISRITPKNSSGNAADLVSGLTLGADKNGRPTLYIGRNGKEEILRVYADDGEFITRFATTNFRIEALTPDRGTYAPRQAVLTKDAYDGEYVAFDVGPLPDEGTGTPSLGAVTDQKLALADQVDSAAAGYVDDHVLADTATGQLSEALETGAIDESVATEAVQRMKLGESVTETVFSGVTSSLPIQTDDNFDIPGWTAKYDEYHSIVPKTSESIVHGIVDIIFSLNVVGKLISKIPGAKKLINAGKSWLAEGVEGSIDGIRKLDFVSKNDYLLRELEEESQDVVKGLLNALNLESDALATTYTQKRANETGFIKSTVEDILIEDNLLSDSESEADGAVSSLESLHSDLSTNLIEKQKHSQADSPFEESLDSVADHVDASRQTIIDEVEGTDDFLDDVATAGDVTEVIGVISEIFGTLGLIFAGVGSLLIAFGTLLEALAGLIRIIPPLLGVPDALQRLRSTHHSALDNITTI